MKAPAHRISSGLPLRFDARMIAHSGIGTQVRNVLRELVHRPELRLHLLGDPAEIRRQLPDYTGPITEFRSKIYSPGEQLFFPAPEPGELLHIPHYNAPLRFLGRSIVILHDLIHLQSDEFKAPQFRLYARMLLSRVARHARRIATVSESTRREFLERYPEAADRTRVIYNGLDHTLFRAPTAARLREFRRRNRLPARFLLTVGIGKRHKNVDFLVRALAPAWKSGALPFDLALAGTGGVLPRYVSDAAEECGVRDRLILLPRFATDELPLLYAAAEVFLMPSLLEGFGFPVVEAMASGTPVLCSNASCLPEIAGDAAGYFDPRNPEDFRRALSELLRTPRLRTRLVQAGLKRARQFHWKKHADQLIELYLEAGGESSPVSG